MPEQKRGPLMQNRTPQRMRPLYEFQAIRGAVQIAVDRPDEIAIGTVAMLRQLVAKNRLRRGDPISFFFTVTPDLSSELPPLVAQETGWAHVPMLCAAELPSQLMIPRVIRVLAHVHWLNKNLSPRHIYLPGTTPVRPDPARLSEAANGSNWTPPC